MKSRNRLVPLVLAAAAMLAAGCTGAGGEGKAGGLGEPIVLRIGTPDSQGRPASDDVEQFASLVTKLSGGAIGIEIVWEAQGGDLTRSDQHVAELVRAGQLDMALVPTRAWDVEGVTSLQALQAPFLITSRSLIDEIVTAPMAGEMLAGLGKVGVTGLALLPEQLRHPFGFGTAFRVRGDFVGAAIQASPSNATYELLRALGATPLDVRGEAFNQGARQGTLDGSEAEFELGSFLPGTTSASADITFFPKVNALVANRTVWIGLTDDQRTTLHTAAAQTLAYVLRTSPSEHDAAAEYCRNGGTIVVSSQAQLAVLEEEAKPVYARMESDPQTMGFIQQIQQLKLRTDATPADVVSLCQPGGVSETPASPAEAQSGRAIPNGSYRKNITIQELLDGGADTAGAYENYGIRTLTFADGHWSDDTISDAFPEGASSCGGVADYSGHHVTLLATDCPSSSVNVVLSASWSFSDGELRFFDATDQNGKTVWALVLFGGGSWKKIG